VVHHRQFSKSKLNPLYIHLTVQEQFCVNAFLFLFFCLVDSSQISITASVAFFFSSILGQLLQSTHKEDVTPATLVMLHLGVLFVWQIFNLFSMRTLGSLSTLSGIFAAGFLVTLVSILLSMTGLEPSANGRVPFATFLNYSGSSSASYAAISSMLMASFIFCPQDTINRMVWAAEHKPLQNGAKRCKTVQTSIINSGRSHFVCPFFLFFVFVV
jgi:amino acid transporter